MRRSRTGERLGLRSSLILKTTFNFKSSQYPSAPRSAPDLGDFPKAVQFLGKSARQLSLARAGTAQIFPRVARVKTALDEAIPRRRLPHLQAPRRRSSW